MSKVIAVVRLAAGQVAFYDERTGMHLTMGNPQREVLDYMDTTRIKRAIQNKVLNLIHGGFAEPTEEPDEKEVHIEVKPVETKAAQKSKAAKVEKVAVKEEVIEDKTPVISIEDEQPVVHIGEAVEEIVTEEAVEEETVEDASEEVKAKSSRRKK